ncbi:MAG: hypothetical protein ACXWUL_11925, partial [Caldimonas sp.]
AWIATHAYAYPLLEVLHIVGISTLFGSLLLFELRVWGFGVTLPLDALAKRTRGLVVGLLEAAQAAGVTMTADCEGGMFGFFFAAELPQNYGAVMATDKERFNRFFHAMLGRGVYLAPALYEAGFVSSAHGHDDIAATVAAAAESFVA